MGAKSYDFSQKAFDLTEPVDRGEDTVARFDETEAIYASLIASFMLLLRPDYGIQPSLEWFAFLCRRSSGWTP